LVLFAILAAACGSVTTTEQHPGAPVIDSISPDNGAISGGTSITLTGANLDDNDTIVLVGDHLSTKVMVASSTQLTFELPPGDQEGEVVDITVANGHGFAVKPAAFTYNKRPVVLSIAPSIGRGAGGTPVTITGRGFQANGAGAPTVVIAGAVATNVTVVNDQTITATSSAAPSGTRPFTPQDVTVTNANGEGILPAAFQITTPGLIVISRDNPMARIFHVDLSSGQASQIAVATQRIWSCVRNPATGVIYVKTRETASPFRRALATLDPLTGQVSMIGPLNDTNGNNYDIGGMTFVGNTLFGINSHGRVPLAAPPSGRLVTINTMTGAVSIVGTTAQAVDRGGIAAKDANTVFYVSSANGSLDTMNTSTSVKTTGLALSGGNSAYLTSIVNAGGNYYALERNSPGGIVYAVNPLTAALTRIANVSTPSLAQAMCETPPTF
jgi:hypothetical protein